MEEDSTSQRPTNSQASIGSSNDDGSAAAAELLLPFRNLGLGKEVSNNHTASSSSSYFSSSNCSSVQTREEEETSATLYQMWLDRTSRIPTLSDQPECSSRQSIPQADDIWTNNYSFINEGDTLVSNMHSGLGSSMGSLNHMNDQYGLNYKPNNFAGNFTGNIASRSYCYGGPSTANLLDQVNGKSVLIDPDNLYQGRGNYGPELHYTAQSPTSHHEFGATGSNGYNSGNGYYSPNGLWNQQGGNFADLDLQILPERPSLAVLPMSEDESQFLQELLQNGNPETTERVLWTVFKSLIELMTDQHGHYVFQKLVEICDYSQLEQIVRKLTLQTPLLVNAAFNRHGSNSIQMLLKQLKKLDLAKFVTLSLATGLYELMTDKTGRHVIVQSLILLDCHKNTVLYQAVIKHFVELATHPVGCIGLNNCIDYIPDPHRHLLLVSILHESVRLSLDPSGNYVVQHVLGLCIPQLCDEISLRLKGNYARLSQIKHGSHVVEKCLQSSRHGIPFLVEDVQKEEGMLERLARDQFGNYVIQTALKISKMVEDFQSLHEFLVMNLQLCLSNCVQNTPAKNVLRLIRELARKAKFDP